MDDQQEREIALGLRDGKSEAWHALYNEFAPSIWQSVARWLGPRHAEIGDVVQETFMAAAGAAGRYDASRGSLGMWLSGIARNKVALYFRRQKRHERLTPGPDGAAAAGRLMLWLEDQQYDPGRCDAGIGIGRGGPCDAHRAAGRLRNAARWQVHRRGQRRAVGRCRSARRPWLSARSWPGHGKHSASYL